MRLAVLATVVATAGLFAVPAYAQTAPQTTMSGHSARQELIDGLKKAGFTDIRVEPEVFIIHAVNQQGDKVLMRVGPDSMTEVTDVPMNQVAGAKTAPPATAKN